MNPDLDILKQEIERLKHAYLDLKEEMILLTKDQQGASMTRKRGALATAGVTCESLLKFVYKNEGLEKGSRPASSLMLEDLVQKLTQVLPPHIVINVRTIQAWRNMGAHDKGDFRDIDDFTIAQVEHSLNSVVNWFFTSYLNEELDVVNKHDANEQNAAPSKETVSSSDEIQMSDIVGYYEQEELSFESGDSWNCTVVHSHIEYLSSGDYTNTWRIIFKPNEPEGWEDEFDETFHEESFLCIDKGTWSFQDNHIIQTLNSSEHFPNPEQSWCKYFFSQVELNFGKQYIFQILSFTENTIQVIKLGSSEKETYKRLHVLNKGVVQQQNEDWLKSVQEQIDSRNIMNALANSEGFLGGHISSMYEFAKTVTVGFENEYSDAIFNGSLPYFNNGWKPISNTILSNFKLPNAILENVVVVSHYQAKVGFIFKKTINVYFAAYSKGFLHEKNDDGDMVATNDMYLLANLLFIDDGESLYRYSLSCWIDEYRDIPCISDLKYNGDVLKIASYQQLSKDNTSDFYNEITLDPRINKVIFNVRQELDLDALCLF
jgi:hypothetical protein